MFSKQFKLAAILLCVGLASFFQASPVQGVAVYNLETYGFVDMAANPNQFASWDGGSSTTLTYRFDSSFTTNAGIRNQVRLAFDQWVDVPSTNDGAKYSYYRNGGAQSFGDIRSIMAHEIGHALYAHHPDVGDDQIPKRNYDVTPPPPVVAADQNNELMRSWVPRGAYNQTLSHDELNGYDYVYGSRVISFNEITSGTPDILISAGPESSSGTWAATRPAGVRRSAGDATQGWRLTSAPINFNTTSTYGMGYRTLGVNWDFQNTGGKPTRKFELVTRGTSNPTPVYHYDGSLGQSFDTLTTVSTADDDHKEDLKHTWSNPRVGGSPGDFPAGNVVHVGLELDVWDWNVESAQIVHDDDSRTDAPILGLHDWNQTETGVSFSSGDGSGESGIHMGPPLRIVAEGMRLVNSRSVATEIVSMGMAMVDDMGLQLQDLNRERLNRLSEAQQFEWLNDGIGGTTLDNGEELFLIFDGKPTGIGNQIRVDPKWAGHELFVFVETKAGEVVVGNYALLGTQPIVGVPEPGAVAMLVAAGLVGLLALRRRRRRL